MTGFKKLAVLFALVLALSTSAFAADKAASVATELKDGTKIEIQGDKVFVIGADGKETPAPDGTHVLKDGTSITTKGGVTVKQ